MFRPSTLQLNSLATVYALFWLVAMTQSLLPSLVGLVRPAADCQSFDRLWQTNGPCFIFVLLLLLLLSCHFKWVSFLVKRIENFLFSSTFFEFFGNFWREICRDTLLEKKQPSKRGTSFAMAIWRWFNPVRDFRRWNISIFYVVTHDEPHTRWVWSRITTRLPSKSPTLLIFFQAPITR